MSRLMLTAVSLLALMSACKADIDESGKGDVDGQDEGDEEEERIPLSFDMVDPAGAAYTEDGIVAVNGVVGGDSPVVTVNGTPAAIEDGLWDGSASHLDVLWPDSPLFPILGEATDAHGGWARDRVVLAKGATTDTSAEIPSAIGARLTDHALVALDPVIQETIAGLDLGELLVSSDPVADILGADVYVTAASLGGATVDLDFTERGLAYTLVASDIDATLLLDFGWFDTDGDLYVERVDISGLVFMEIQDGELSLTPLETAASISGLEIFGFDDPTGLVDSLVNSFLAETLAELLEEQVVELADDLLDVLSEITDLEFSGIVFDTRFSELTHDVDGLTLFADTTVSVSEGVMPAERLSNPGAPQSISGMTTDSGEPYAIALFLDDDLLSALGAGLLGTGVLEQEVGGDLGGLTLDTSLLAASVPGFDTLPAGEEVTLAISPTLAPLGTVGAASPEAGRLHIGGLMADFLVPTVQEEPVMTVALDAVVGLGLGEEELLAVDVVDTEVTLLSTTLGSTPTEVEPGLDTLIGLAVPLLLGDVLGDSLDLSSLPVELLPVGSGPEGDRAALYLDLGDLSGLEL